MINYIISIAILIAPVLSYSGGAPKETCGDLTPRHRDFTTQTAPPPYSLLVETEAIAGQPLNIVLKGNKNDDNIKGFIIQARHNNNPVGKFVPGSLSQTLECNLKDDTLTHRKIDKENINKIEAKWIPGAELKGKTVEFVTTVVKQANVFWVKKLTKKVNIK
ncbi:defense protein l(2)34Fc-like [Condylostylus longicornis]|uniref:defense protein l(2)34Fc-like n=1 Tax=Condylostylus longicornis TaxID=2530218 RepID=UPI00244E2FF9|nr:defense protein l(2)34Fc-like [Condylostylus longicornis]